MIFAETMFTYNHLIHGRMKRLHFPMRTRKLKDNGEGKQFASSFSVGEHKSSTKEGGVVNDEKGSFGSNPK